MPSRCPTTPTGDLVSGEWYTRYLRDLHQEFAAALPVPLILHICGKTLDRMAAIAEDRFRRLPLRLQE